MFRVLILLGVIFLLSPVGVAAQPFTPPTYTHQAISNGLWHLSSTWENGLVPGNDAFVLIPDGKQVIVVTEETARLTYIQVEGELRMAISHNTELKVETLFVAASGTFRIGDPVNTLPSDKQAKITIINDGQPIDTGWDATEASRGFISAGKVRIYGHPKTYMAEMDLSAAKGQSAIDLNLPVPADWQPYDQIVLTGTTFKRDTNSSDGHGSELQDELREINQIVGQVIYLDAPLSHDHSRVSTAMNLHVANLTRNVIFESESDVDLDLRGHVMLMHSDVDIRHAAFINLGRTNKAIPLDEVIVQSNGTTTANPNIQNRRGRYSLHFHLNGIQPGQDPPSKVYGSVVINTPGWAFVNHSSHVDFRENVAYDFVGAGFVTEAGDELGNFFNNIAIRGTGDGAYRPDRLVFANPARPQPLSDFAFSGDGFWFQGPAVRARDNVANSCNGAGMIWFTPGAVDIGDGNYVGFPRGSVAGAYSGYPDINNLEPRNWDYDTDALVISDLPILECDGFDGYANLVGFRLRFNNFNNLAFYGEGSFPYDGQIEVPTGGTQRIRQSVTGLNLWNNELGFRVRYNQQTDWSDIKNINLLRHNQRKAKIGAEFVFQTRSNTFDNLLIRGYGIAGLIEAVSNNQIVDNRPEITLTNTTYESYANPDTRSLTSCDEATGVSASNVTTTSATINWDPDVNAERFLVRYRPSTSEHWTFRQVHKSQSSVPLTGLLSGTEYDFQVVIGCAENASFWSWNDKFTTLTDP